MQANYLAADGYRYGVRFQDGSVSSNWNGRTQRERAEEALAWWCEKYPRDARHLVLVRWRPGGSWEPVPR